jgi:hypothetical protein
MADKIIQIRIDVKKINKSWLYEGEKGTYLDATLFYNEEQDTYESNGMITQSVPKSVYEAEKGKPSNERTRGSILGNAREYKKGEGGNRESVPGAENKKGNKATAAAAAPEEANDDLPF